MEISDDGNVIIHPENPQSLTDAINKSLGIIQEITTSIIEKSAYDLHKENLAKNHPPLCKDCYYVSIGYTKTLESYRCFHPKNYLGINLVDGEQIFLLPLCTDQRITNPNIHRDVCGRDGNWFKQRPIDPVISVEVSNVSKLTPAWLKKKKLSDSDLGNL